MLKYCACNPFTVLVVVAFIAVVYFFEQAKGNGIQSWIENSIWGIGTTLGLITFAMFGALPTAIWVTTFSRWEEFSQGGSLEFAIGLTVACLLLIGAAMYPFLREAFYYTHLPIRLNRKNRKIYIWRKTGVVTAPWDKTFFFLRKYRDTALEHWEVRGNILDSDGKTVIDSFPFSSYESVDRKDVEHHFEYFRRYMEVGPQQTWRMLKVCLPIAKRKETWWEGFMRLMLLMHGVWIMQVLFSPFWFVMSLGRWFAMKTSCIPEWPEWVERECAVEPGDACVRESGDVAPREKSH